MLLKIRDLIAELNGLVSRTGDVKAVIVILFSRMPPNLLILTLLID